MKRIVVTVLCGVMLGWLSDAAIGGDQGTEVVLGDLKTRTPASWKAKKLSPLRKYSFAVPHAPGDGQDGDLAIFQFAGSAKVDDNLKRWKSQFKAPDGKTIEDVTKIEKMKIGKAEGTYADISGTYTDPFAKNAQPMPNYRRLGVIFESGDSSYYITFTGPAKTVEQNKKDFDNWLKSFK